MFSTARSCSCAMTSSPIRSSFLACEWSASFFVAKSTKVKLNSPPSHFRVIFSTLLFLSFFCTTINVIRKQLNDQALKRGQGTNSRECLDVEKVGGKRPRKPLWDKFMTCFLVHENARIIFSTYLAPSSLHAIHGVRSISLAWIIMAHLFVYTVSSIGNLPRVLTFVGDWYMQPFNSAAIAVDTFYVLG